MDQIAGSGSRLTFGGLASGLDTGAIIEALLTAERRPVQLLQSRRENLESQQTALQTLSSNVLALRNAARGIDNRSSLGNGPSFDEEFLGYKATSSDEARLEVEVTGNSAPDNFELEINQVATIGRNISASFADPDAPVTIGASVLLVSYGGEEDILLSNNPSATLSELRDLINSDVNNDGSVKATLLDDGTGTRLVISGTKPGADNDLLVFSNLTAPGGGNFIETEQNAVNAELTYLGVSVTRPTNEITDLVPGMSLRLRGETEPGTPIEIGVSRDDESIEARLQELVDAFNSVQSFVNEQTAIDPATNRGGILIGDSLVRSVATRARNALIQSYDFGGDNEFTSISNIGLELQADGTLKINGERLRAALDKDPVAVRELLAGTGEGETRKEGVASALALALDDIVKPGNAFFKARDESLSTSMRSIDTQIERLEFRLGEREEFLVRQFSQLETLISTIRSQSGFLGGE